MPGREEEFLDLLKGIGQEAQPIDPGAIDKDQELDSEAVSVETVGDKKPGQPAGAPPTPVPLSSKNVFVHHDAHPLLLGALLLSKYGPPWLEWEPETLWQEIKDDFNHPTISVHTRNKIQAVKTLHLVDTPWTAWEVFVPICSALTNNLPDFRMLHKPTPAQVFSTVSMMGSVRKVPFGEEVQKLIAAAFLDEGIYYLPPPVDFAQDEALMKTYRCRDCGNIDRDEGAESCDACGSRNLERTSRFEMAPVEKRYRSVIADRKGANPSIELQENEVDVQVAKLIVARDFMLLREQQLEEQARIVGA